MENNTFELSERKRDILLNAVENYIENALPITSEKVQINCFKELSSATLRNELSALEEMGYLKQLHTSSGRVPTTKAYRYFVDSVINSKALNSKKIKRVEAKFEKRSSFLMQVLDDIAKKVSELSGIPAFVSLEGIDNMVVQAINIIPLITGEGLLLLQTNAGIINNTIKLDEGISEDNCKDASKFLTTNLANKKVKDILDNYEEYNKLFKTQIVSFQELFLSLTDILKEYVSSKKGFVSSINTTRFLDEPELKDVNKAKEFLEVVENKEKIKEIINDINRCDTSELTFSIGEENENKAMKDYSIISANYSLVPGIRASVGVVGPKRLDYMKVASILKFIVDNSEDKSN